VFPGVQHEVEIQGDRTGRIWRFRPSTDRLETGGGERYRATAIDDGSFACLHCCDKGGLWLDEAERLEAAVLIVSRPEIVAAPTIRQLLDLRVVEPDTREFFERPGNLVGIWEWGDISLEEFLVEPDDDRAAVADAVETNVGAALDALHGIGFVHLDVAPNNILRVDGSWKLADFDSCVERGQPAVRGPIFVEGGRYLHPDRKDAVPPAARDEFDLYGLREILKQLR
jgi:hypothetical protein